MANTYLSRTTGTPTQQNTWTWSAWVKFSDDNKVGATDSTLLSEYYNAGSYTKYERIANNTLRYGTGVSGQGSFVTNRRFSDLNAWYHLVIVNDWSNSTTADRIKLYVNGVRETSFASFVAPSSGSSRINGDSEALRIGTLNNTLFFNGSMSYVAFVDGTAELPTIFGETDSVTGQWKIKTDITPSVAWGNNGFLILKNGNSLTDESTNTNNFTLGGGTLTNTLDCPSNVFATLNPLYNSGGTVTYSNGNNTFTEPDSQWKTTFSTLGASSGKYYAEFKSNGNYTQIGVADYNVTKSGTADYNFASSTVISTQGYGYYNGNGDLYYRGSSTSYGDTYGNGDIIQVGLDCDNNRVFFGKNGVWQNSADPTNSGTGFAMTATNATYVFALAVTSNPCDANFGNGFFGTSAVADNSTATASTPGTFNYDVPTGYQPLSTKGLNA